MPTRCLLNIRLGSSREPQLYAVLLPVAERQWQAGEPAYLWVLASVSTSSCAQSSKRNHGRERTKQRGLRSGIVANMKGSTFPHGEGRGGEGISGGGVGRGVGDVGI